MPRKMAKRIPYQLVIKQRKDYLYVEYGGVGLTFQAILDMINVSAQSARTLGTKRVLMVRNMPLFESDSDRQMVANVIRSVVPPGVRFALVDKFGNDPARSARGLSVLRDSGWDVTEFPTVAEAAAWLTSE